MKMTITIIVGALIALALILGHKQNMVLTQCGEGGCYRDAGYNLCQEYISRIGYNGQDLNNRIIGGCFATYASETFDWFAK